jgi:hypothetical protein
MGNPGRCRPSHRWKPWQRATGPRTADGKRKISQNAYNGGEWLMLRFRREKRSRSRLTIEAALVNLGTDACHSSVRGSELFVKKRYL